MKAFIEALHDVIEEAGKGVADITEFVQDTNRRLTEFYASNPGSAPAPLNGPTTGFYL
jgi:hypothetical protein